jgi:hypothetical protein
VSIIIPIYKKGKTIYHSTYSSISLLSISYNILSNILFQDYVVEITDDHQCGLQCNRTTTDQISCIHQILEKKLECSETVHQLFTEFKKAYDLVRREVLCNIFTEFGVPMKLVMLIKMCLNETCSRVCAGKY